MSNELVYAIEVYVEDQRVDEFQQGTETLFELKDKLNHYRDELAHAFQEGVRKDAFLEMWDRALNMIENGIIDSSRWAMVPTDFNDGVMIFRLRAM